MNSFIACSFEVMKKALRQPQSLLDLLDKAGQNVEPGNTARTPSPPTANRVNERSRK